MAETGPMDRLLPCLLDRLTDDEPHMTQEGRDKRVISMRRYRERVLQDLEWLLNAHCHGRDDPVEDYPQARQSVLNFGLPDFSGSTVSSGSAQDVERALLRAIQTFEPRILPNTLNVRAIQAREDAYHGNAVVLEIQGVLWAQPVPERLYVQTEIDLETGQCNIKERGNG